MSELVPTLIRNKRLVGLFVLMVLAPAFVFSVLIVRAIRSEELRLAYGTIERQRRVVELAEADLNDWLFSAGSDAARQHARLRFELTGGQIVFPDFQLALPAAETSRVRPFEAAPPPGLLTADAVTTQYYPRIQTFLRDMSSGRNLGAQHFLRLRALIVRSAASAEGYVVDVQLVLDRVNRTLAALCENESFKASVWIPDAEQRTAPGGVAYSLQNFPFFEVVFADSGAAAVMNVRRHAFAYSMTALVAFTVLGSLFVHRALSHEVRLAELRTGFVAAVSHELRSPLSSILALAERLAAERPIAPDQLAEYHRIIAYDAGRLSVLITRLLEFGRIEDGKATYSLAPMDLVAVAREAIDSVQHIVKADRLRFAGAEAGPLWVRADSTALGHAIQNLIENAAKYSPVDSTIDIICAAEERWHVLDVRDRGIGIPAGEQSRIFDKFYRGRAGADLNVQGVGIGLALVKHVIAAHGGTVSVESTIGEGSRFRIRLPRVEG